MTPEEIRKTALETRELYAGRSAKHQTQTLKELIQGHELVFGVFPDGDYVVIKGRQMLEQIVQSGLPGLGVTWTAIMCGRGPDEAAAMSKVFGDGAISN